MSTEQEEVADFIIEQCMSSEGLLYTTNARFAFDQARFDQLIHGLELYQALLGFEKLIDRRVSGCIYDLARTIDIAWSVSISEKLASATDFETASIELDEVSGQLFWWGET